MGPQQYLKVWIKENVFQADLYRWRGLKERVSGSQSQDFIVGLDLGCTKQFLGLPVCGKCGLEEESSFHVLCQCDALVGYARGIEVKRT